MPNALRTLIARLRGLGTRALDADSRQVVANLTLLLLVLYGAKHWQLRVPTIMLAATGLAVPYLSIQWWYWLAITVIQALGVFRDLYDIDNHKVLMVYWCLALAMSSRHGLVRVNARLLIGLCFAFASFWKWATPGFRDGSFLHFTFLTDSRFSSFARIVCDVSDASLERNKQLVRGVMFGTSSCANLLDSTKALPLAIGATAWTLLSETAIAACYLAPLPRSVASQARAACLVQFIVFTYPIATVIGFAWLLCLMGYAACSLQDRLSRAAFLILFVLLQLYTLPWGALA